MTMPTTLIFGAALGVPSAMMLACVSRRLRGALSPYLGLGAAPALVAAVAANPGERLVMGHGRVAFHLMLDAPGALLFGTAALLWMLAGFFASRATRDSAASGGFVVCWTMTMTGSIGVFLAADVVSLYFLLAVLSVGACGLVLYGHGPRPPAHARPRL